MVLLLLGQAAWGGGDTAGARRRFTESLSACRSLREQEAGGPPGSALSWLGRAAGGAGDFARAARLLGAGAAVLARWGGVVALETRAACEGAAEQAKAALGAEAFEREWAAGAAMPLGQAIDYALE
jgi:hypothetical protein